METIQYTGAFLNPVDSRQIKYSDLPQAAETVAMPAFYDTDISMLPVENQGQQGACVAYALMKIVQYKEYVEKGVVKPLSKRYIYSLTRSRSNMIGWPQQGLYPADAAKMVVSGGTWDQDSQDDVTLTPAVYERMVITDQMTIDASQYRLGGFAQVDPNVIAMKQAIMKEGLIAISLPCTDNFVGAHLIKPSYISSSWHYTVLYGWKDLPNGDVEFHGLNSWGTTFGDQGKYNFNFSDYVGYVRDMLVFTDIPDEILKKAKEASFAFTKPLQKGSTGSDVLVLQQYLNKFGFGNIALAPIYGPATTAAVYKLQLAGGITGDGGVHFGPQTRAYFNKLIAAADQDPGGPSDISPAGIDLIKGFEGLVLTPYQDVAGVWTIGYGSTLDLEGKPVTAATPALTEAQAEQLLISRLASFTKAVKTGLTVAVKQNQFDALCSLCYNIGTAAFAASTVLAHVNAGNVTRADFVAYSKARDPKSGLLVTVQGLINRRNLEANFYGLV